MTIPEFLVTMVSVLLTSLTTNYLLEKTTGTALSRKQLFFMWIFSGAFLVFGRPYIESMSLFKSYLQPDQNALAAEQTPVVQALVKREVNFKDAEAIIEEQKTEVATNFGKYIFSNHGAALIESDAYQGNNNKNQLLRTVETTPERFERSFIVAFESHPTPYYYKLVSHEKNETSDTITYQAALSATDSIEKQFVIHHSQPYIDCAIKLKQVTNTAEQIRIIFSGPYLKELHYDNLSAVFSARYGQRKIEVVADLEAAALTAIEKPE
jgi:hypothetical protein